MHAVLAFRSAHLPQANAHTRVVVGLPDEQAAHFADAIWEACRRQHVSWRNSAMDTFRTLHWRAPGYATMEPTHPLDFTAGLPACNTKRGTFGLEQLHLQGSVPADTSGHRMFTCHWPFPILSRMGPISNKALTPAVQSSTCAACTSLVADFTGPPSGIVAGWRRP